MGQSAARLLVVDDDPIVLDVLTHLLAQAGHAMATAGTGEDALRLARERAFDLVVLDVRLPDVDGLEVCRRLRAEHGTSPAILLLSAHDRRGAVPGLEAGADDFLSKPFDTDELLARVGALLRLHAAERSARRMAERLLGLQRVSSALLSQFDEDRIMRSVLDEARRLLDASGVALYLWDEAAELFRPRHVIAPDLPDPPRDRRPREGIVGLAFHRREAVYVNDYAGWEGAPADSRGAGVNAAVAAPLIVGDRVLGVISARRVCPGARFDEQDARLLGLLATPAAVALNNARLYADQRAAAARSAERAAQLEALLESMADGVLMLGADGAITSANRAVAELLGRERSSLVGARLEAVLPPLRWPDGRPLPARELPFGAASGPPTSTDEREVLADLGGRERVLVSITTPLLDADGAPAGAVSVLRDVTDRRRAQDLAAQADKLRALGQMASGVAHDVNNLLATVLGRAELARLELARGEIDAERLGEALRLIEQAAEDGAQTVRRIQEFSRIRRDAPIGVVDLAGIVRDAVDLTRPQWRDAAQAAGRRVAVRLDLEDGLYVEGEAAELREVLTNLILNAVDAMPKGGAIAIEGRRRDDAVRLVVGDTGVGMTATVARRVFEPFFTTKAEAGTGLGLAVVYGIVKRRGGQITVESAPDEGTRFMLQFPAAEPPKGPARQARRRAGPARRLLIVDDEAALVGMLGRLLESEGHVVTVCTGGAEALAAFDPDAHEVVVTDLGMPDVNGLELAVAIQARSPRTPVILATGWGNELDPDNPPPGVARVLAKPYRLAVVVDAVNAVLADRGEAPDRPAGSAPDRPAG